MKYSCSFCKKHIFDKSFACYFNSVSRKELHQTIKLWLAVTRASNFCLRRCQAMDPFKISNEREIIGTKKYEPGTYFSSASLSSTLNNIKQHSDIIHTSFGPLLVRFFYFPIVCIVLCFLQGVERGGRHRGFWFLKFLSHCLF